MGNGVYYTLFIVSVGNSILNPGATFNSNWCFRFKAINMPLLYQFAEYVVKLSTETGIMCDPFYIVKTARAMMLEMKRNPGRFKGSRILFIHTGKNSHLFVEYCHRELSEDQPPLVGFHECIDLFLGWLCREEFPNLSVVKSCTLLLHILENLHCFKHVI